MNPVLIKNGNPVAVDARILVSPLEVSSSLHLVISPYPEGDESHMVSVDGRRIFIRPVKPEDAPLFTALFKVLSPTTIYYRFFGMLKELKPEMLARFTQVDYDREIALVAIDEESETDRMLGVARIIGDPDGKTGEFAVLVGDAWQGQGIVPTCWKNACQLPKSKVMNRCTVSCCMRTGTCLPWGKSWVLQSKEMPTPETMNWSFIGEGIGHDVDGKDRSL